MLGASAPTKDGTAPDGPDMARLAIACPVPNARFLFRAPVGDKESCLVGVAIEVGCVRGGWKPVAVSVSCLSTRLDIGDEVEK
jgi:hypothetical protein